MRFRQRFPELASELGFFEPGPGNSITDVAGVRVGHATVRNPVRGLHTGVTAIWPRADVYDFRPRASGFVLHGAGEMLGLQQVLDWGLLETPILLTSTLNVGRAHDALIEYLAEKHPRMGLSEDVLIPVVAECDDSFLSRARERAVGPREVRAALDAALKGRAAPPVAEGSVGAGTGMIAFDYKGGIGTSSRRVPVGTELAAGEGTSRRARKRGGKGSASREFTVGALVNANFGFRRQLRAAGRALGRKLDGVQMREERRSPRGERSVIVVLATDAPMRPDQLRRLSVRASMGLARAGSFAGHASGELIVAFTTGLGEPREPASPIVQVPNLPDAFLNPFYEACVEWVEEAVLNALAAGSVFAKEPYEGRDGNRVWGFPG